MKPENLGLSPDQAFILLFWAFIVAASACLLWLLLQQAKLWQLGSRNRKLELMYNLNLEKQLNVYSELWATLADMRFVSVPLEEEVGNLPAEKKLEDWEKVACHFEKVARKIELHRPFFSEDVYKQLEDLLDLISEMHPTNEELQKKIGRYLHQINEQTEDICEEIRSTIIL